MLLDLLRNLLIGQDETSAKIRRGKSVFPPNKNTEENRARPLRRPKPETPNPKPETRNPKPETLNPKPETRNPKPETLNPLRRLHDLVSSLDNIL